MILRVLALLCLACNLISASALPADYYVSDEDIFYDKMSLANASQSDEFYVEHDVRPKRSAAESVTFYLYNYLEEEPTILNVGDSETLENSTFDASIPTKVVIHGWDGNAYLPWVMDFKDTYLSSKEYNIIILEWTSPSKSIWDYMTAVRATEEIGEHLSDFLTFIKGERTEFSLDDVHIVGYSLGAHIAGYAGKNLNGEIGRITALDAASPLFEFLVLVEPEKRLDPTDAKFVDSIHTNGGGPTIMGLKFSLGFEIPLGHVDFYPNGGGLMQPGCGVHKPSCNHKRAYQLMLESIKYPNNFPSAKCKTYGEFENGRCRTKRDIAYMGEFVSKNARGRFFLDTNSNTPFGKGTL